jgi:hypothetical protein
MEVVVSYIYRKIVQKDDTSSQTCSMAFFLSSPASLPGGSLPPLSHILHSGFLGIPSGRRMPRHPIATTTVM